MPEQMRGVSKQLVHADTLGDIRLTAEEAKIAARDLDAIGGLTHDGFQTIP
jgi:hypothetical protein